MLCFVARHSTSTCQYFMEARLVLAKDTPLTPFFISNLEAHSKLAHAIIFANMHATTFGVVVSPHLSVVKLLCLVVLRRIYTTRTLLSIARFHFVRDTVILQLQHSVRSYVLLFADELEEGQDVARSRALAVATCCAAGACKWRARARQQWRHGRPAPRVVDSLHLIQKASYPAGPRPH